MQLRLLHSFMAFSIAWIDLGEEAAMEIKAD